MNITGGLAIRVGLFWGLFSQYEIAEYVKFTPLLLHSPPISFISSCKTNKFFFHMTEQGFDFSHSKVNFDINPMVGKKNFPACIYIQQWKTKPSPFFEIT